MIFLNLNKPCVVCNGHRFLRYCFTDVTGWELVPLIGYVGYDDPAHCENCKAVVAAREIISYVEREIGESPENGKRGNHVAL